MNEGFLYVSYNLRFDLSYDLRFSQHARLIHKTLSYKSYKFSLAFKASSSSNARLAINAFFSFFLRTF